MLIPKIVAVALLIACALSAQSDAPVSLGQIRKALDLIQTNRERSDPAAGKQRLAAAVRQRGVDFNMDAAVADSLRQTGATDELLAAIAGGYRAPVPPPKPPDPLEQARSAAVRKDWPAAQTAYASALSNLSVVLTFSVLAARPGDNFGEPCQGILTLSKSTGVAIESADCEWKQQFPIASVDAVRPNQFMGARLSAFRLLVSGTAVIGGRPAVLSFAPLSSDPGERAMLMSLVEQLR